MPILDNEQWEAFAREVAKGSTLTKAYLKAGYDTTVEGASASGARLLGNVSVAARIAELQELAVQKTLVTIEKLTDELEDARELAMKDDKGAAAAVSAVMAKAKLHGLDVSKHEMKGGFTVNVSSADAEL